MKINTFQQAEINSHKDPELQWLVQETIALFFKNKNNLKNGTFKPINLFKFVGNKVTETIAQREGFNDKNHMLTAQEAGDYLWRSYKEIYPDKSPKHKSYDEMIMPFLDPLINACLLRTRVPIQTNYDDGYWPFGQEGGFCNPNKFKY